MDVEGLRALKTIDEREPWQLEPWEATTPELAQAREDSIAIQPHELAARWAVLSGRIDEITQGLGVSSETSAQVVVASENDKTFYALVKRNSTSGVYVEFASLQDSAWTEYPQAAEYFFPYFCSDGVVGTDLELRNDGAIWHRDDLEFKKSGVDDRDRVLAVALAEVAKWENTAALLTRLALHGAIGSTN